MTKLKAPIFNAIMDFLVFIGLAQEVTIFSDPHRSFKAWKVKDDRLP